MLIPPDEFEALSPENTLVFLSLIQENDGLKAAMNVTESLMEMDPDRAAFVIHNWVNLLNDLMSELLEHVDNDPINMYIH